MFSLSTSSPTIAAILDRTGILLPIAGLSIIVLAFIYNDRTPFSRARRPGVYYPPKAWPLLGHTVEVVKMGTTRELEMALEFSKRSKVGGWQLNVAGQGNIISLSRPEYIEAMQKTYFENLVKGDFARDRMADVLGQNGIFVADGHTWKHARKTASHIFSAGQFRNWVQVVVHEELDKAVSLLNEVTSTERSSSSKNNTQGVITLPELFFRYTLNSFARMAFGTDIGCLTNDPGCLDTPVAFAVAFDYAQHIINERIFTPFFQVVEFFHPKGKKMQKAITTIRQFAGDIIDDRLRDRKVNVQKETAPQPGSIAQLAKKDGKDLLDLFMETTQDREELLIVVLNFLIAGRDTTAQLLSWFFYEMMAHPEHLDGIRRELTEVLGECPAEGYRLPYDRMRDLPFTFACITEALRLHPSVPKNGKQCIKDTLLVPAAPNQSNLPPIQIYKGELVGWSDWVMARLPEVWGADCEEYKPSRFLVTDAEGKSGTKQYSQWQQHMFNGGPRLCLGMNLANFEALSIVAAIVPLFDFHWARTEQGQTASWPPKYISSITHPMEPYQVEFRRRERS
ncbi:hypothetical protein CF327_g5848 [Tilletia walkeri]|nr:hypothetical protein CF327_g5848 [Tilletia walkeri]